MISNKHSFAVVRSMGLNDIVISTHNTMEQAEAKLCKLGGQVTGICGNRSIRIVPLEYCEIIEHFGNYTIRPIMVR